MEIEEKYIILEETFRISLQIKVNEKLEKWYKCMWWVSYAKIGDWRYYNQAMIKEDK